MGTSQGIRLKGDGELPGPARNCTITLKARSTALNVQLRLQSTAMPTPCTWAAAAQSSPLRSLPLTPRARGAVTAVHTRRLFDRCPSWCAQRNLQHGHVDACPGWRGHHPRHGSPRLLWLAIAELRELQVYSERSPLSFNSATTLYKDPATPATDIKQPPVPHYVGIV